MIFSKTSDADYVNEEGLLCCAVCGKKKQHKVFVMGSNFVFDCMCDCEQKEKTVYEERIRLQNEERDLYYRRQIGLSDKRFWNWTFGNDDGMTPKMGIAKNYVKHWQKMKQGNMGLLLIGDVGCGKSYMAGCIANALIDSGERILMTNFSKILNELMKYETDKNQMIQDLVSYPLLIIDDFGIERSSGFALEQIYSIIDSRYRAMKPLIVTTNLTLQELKADDLDISRKRIYSRLLEMCTPVVCKGADRRRKIASDKKDRMIALLYS